MSELIIPRKVKKEVEKAKNVKPTGKATVSAGDPNPRITDTEAYKDWYFKNLPKQTDPGYVRNKDRNVKCFCGSNRKVKYCCSWKTVANFVIARGHTWYKKVNDGQRGNRQIDLAGMPVRKI